MCLESEEESLCEKSAWNLILTTVIHCGQDCFGVWTAVELFLEFGAQIPSWRRIGKHELLLEFGSREFNVTNNLFGGGLPPALQDWPSDLIRLKDFVNLWQPYNAAAITRLLDARTKDEVEIGSSKRPIYVESIEGIHNGGVEKEKGDD
jgi:hypothetical protein